MASEGNEHAPVNAAEGTEPERKITRRDLWSMAFRSLFLQSSFNYERMQAGGWLYSLLPALKRVFKDKEELSESMKRHLDFFNTHPFLVTPMLGIIAAMEEKREQPEAIRAIRVAMMGPLGGIGDAIAWLTLLPIAAGIGSSIAMEGNIAGPIIFLLLFNAIHIVLRFGGMFYGYRTGVRAVKALKTGAKAISHAASIVGVTVAGALIASYVTLETPLVVNAGEAELEVQTDILDKIMPNMLPLGYTFLLYFLLKRGFSPIKLIGLTVLIGVLGKLIGIL